MPCFINNLIHFQNHCLCQFYLQQNQLLLNYVVQPIIMDNQFWFAIDKKKLDSFKILANLKKLNLHLFKNILNYFTLINLPFDNYLKLDNLAKKKFSHLFLKLGLCSIFCNCRKYHYHEYLNFEQFFKNNVKYFQKACCPF